MEDKKKVVKKYEDGTYFGSFFWTSRNGVSHREQVLLGIYGDVVGVDPFRS